jgi:hypothetical protein
LPAVGKRRNCGKPSTKQTDVEIGGLAARRRGCFLVVARREDATYANAHMSNGWVSDVDTSLRVARPLGRPRKNAEFAPSRGL